MCDGVLCIDARQISLESRPAADGVTLRGQSTIEQVLYGCYFPTISIPIAWHHTEIYHACGDGSSGSDNMCVWRWRLNFLGLHQGRCSARKCRMPMAGVRHTRPKHSALWGEKGHI